MNVILRETDIHLCSKHKYEFLYELKRFYCILDALLLITISSLTITNFYNYDYDPDNDFPISICVYNCSILSAHLICNFIYLILDENKNSTLWLFNYIFDIMLTFIDILMVFMVMVIYNINIQNDSNKIMYVNKMYTYFMICFGCMYSLLYLIILISSLISKRYLKLAKIDVDNICLIC
jgi:hypothetical protein